MVHIKSSDDYAWRQDLYDRVGEQLGERTTSGAIDGACEFTEQMVPNLERAIEHPDMTEELAEVLSTQKVRLEYRIETESGSAAIGRRLELDRDLDRREFTPGCSFVVQNGGSCFVVVEPPGWVCGRRR